MKNLVLIDFTDESIHALEYAVAFSKSIKGKLELINVTKSLEFDQNFEKLEFIRSKYSSEDFYLEIKSIIGTLDHDLPIYIEDQKIGFVFCGTHNLKLQEYLFSSRALKLMNHIEANFLFIPTTLKTFRPIKHVLAPILTNKHSLQKLEALRYLRLMMDFKLSLITYRSSNSDENHVLNEQLIIAGKILEKANINFEVDYIGRSENELKSMLIEHSVENDVDMISLVNLTKSGLINLNSKAFMDALIRNDYKIPILAIQDRQVSSYSGHQISGGV